MIFQGYLQVATVVTGPANPNDAIKMGLAKDDKGIYAHDIQTLMDLDVMREDFTFHQGNIWGILCCSRDIRFGIVLREGMEN